MLVENIRATKIFCMRDTEIFRGCVYIINNPRLHASHGAFSLSLFFAVFRSGKFHADEHRSGPFPRLHAGLHQRRREIVKMQFALSDTLATTRRRYAM